MRPELIDTPSGVADLVSRSVAASRIAVDVEANGRFAFRARLSMMQLAWDGEVALVDPLAPGMSAALGQLGPLLDAGGPVKIIHDVGFDARLLADAGLTLGNVHDTALMAQWLGRPATGLASLAKAEFDVTLDKSLQAEDWAARPLSEQALHYLASDVLHLLALDDVLFAEATERCIVAELSEEISYRLRTAERAVADPDMRPPYVRLKGIDKVSKADLPVLRRVAQARAEEAERLDTPEGELIPSAVLLTIARVRPSTRDELARIRSPIARRDSDAVGRAILEAVRLGALESQVPTGDHAWLERPRLPPDVVQLRRAREARLMAWRHAEATTRQVSEQVVLPGHCAAEIITRGPTDLTELARIEGIGAFRIARYGEAIVGTICGPASELLLPSSMQPPP